MAYKDEKGQCVAEYGHIPEPQPVPACFCKPQGCKVWDDINAALAYVTALVLIIMLFGAIAFAIAGS
jgi:hypothetical protein